MGRAHFVNTVANLIKIKVIALLLGPAGVGLIGLYTNLVETAATVAAFGIGNVGTRQIAVAEAEGGQVAVGRTRRALFWGALGLSLIGGAAFYLFSGWIAEVLLDDVSLANDLAWLSVAVTLTVLAGAQGALLMGLQRVGDIARINMGSGVLAAILGVCAVWQWGTHGLIAAILITPVTAFALGHIYVSRLGAPIGSAASLPELTVEWRGMARVGFAFMLSSLITLLGHLAARTLVHSELGTEALGHFQAAWTIGMTYLGFVLAAMATDYYPRLSAAINDPAKATRLVNEQTEVVLLLSTPAILALLGLAPWVIQLLYSAEFGPAVHILRWHLVGDMLRVMSWPLCYILIASGAGRSLVMNESLCIGIFVGTIFFGLPIFGVTATGIAFLAQYLAYLPIFWWLGHRLIGFRYKRIVANQAAAALVAVVAVDLTARWSEWAGAVVGLTLATLMGFWAVVRLSKKTGLEPRLAQIQDRLASLKEKRK